MSSNEPTEDAVQGENERESVERSPDRRGLLIAGVTLLACFGLVSYGMFSTEEPPKPQAVPTAEVTYEVTGSGTAEISYLSRSEAGTATVENGVMLPWRKSVLVPLGKAPTVAVVLDGKGGKAACTLAIRGKYIQRATAMGVFGRATCTGELPPSMARGETAPQDACRGRGHGSTTGCRTSARSGSGRRATRHPPRRGRPAATSTRGRGKGPVVHVRLPQVEGLAATVAPREQSGFSRRRNQRATHRRPRPAAEHGSASPPAPAGGPSTDGAKHDAVLLRGVDGSDGLHGKAVVDQKSVQLLGLEGPHAHGVVFVATGQPESLGPRGTAVEGPTP